MVNVTRALCLMCVFALIACGDEKTVTLVENDGALCVSPTTEGIDVKVVFDACISPGCDHKESASCAATLADGRIQITSHAVVAHVRDETRFCAAACVPPATTCSLGVAQAGTYEVMHGVSMGTITLPLSAPVALGADDPCQRLTE